MDEFFVFILLLRLFNSRIVSKQFLMMALQEVLRYFKRDIESQMLKTMILSVKLTINDKLMIRDSKSMFISHSKTQPYGIKYRRHLLVQVY